MKETQGRALLYGCAVLVLGGIAVAWSNTNTEADVTTLLSSADVQLRMAHAIPAEDLDGNELDQRPVMINSAIEMIERVEKIQPGMAVASEFRGFAHMLQGQFSDAAACYRRARQCEDCQDEQFDVLAFNEARMLAKAGSRERALAVFKEHSEALDARFGHQRILEEATILRELGRRSEARGQLEFITRDSTASPMATLQAGREYLALGCDMQAEHALERVRNELPIADYHLAQLKLRQGETDTAFELLTRASSTRPAEVRQMLREEAEVWSAVAEDERFVQLTRPQPASPGR